MFIAPTLKAKINGIFSQCVTTVADIRKKCLTFLAVQGWFCLSGAIGPFKEFVLNFPIKLYHLYDV